MVTKAKNNIMMIVLESLLIHFILLNKFISGGATGGHKLHLHLKIFSFPQSSCLQNNYKCVKSDKI